MQVENNVNKWSAQQGETYQEVPGAKLTNTALANDYKDKLVTFKSSFWAILDRPKVTDYDPKEFLGISFSSYGIYSNQGGAEDKVGIMFYNILEKSKYDMVGSLKQGEDIKVSGRAEMLLNGLLVIYIHKIEVLH